LGVATDDAAKTNRDKLLDELKEANDAFFNREMKRIDAEEAFCRDVLKARSSTKSLAKANAAVSRVLLIHDIGTFLSG
jgi:hypothetical protein